MRHYYLTKRFGRENWFGWEPLYAEMVQRYPGGTFVELGSWKGRSTAFLGVEAINAGTDIRIYAVDVWSDDISGGAKKTMVEQGLDGNALYTRFMENVAPVASAIVPMRMTTTQAASNFADGSVDFVFIDADHSYEAVKQDIQTWLPKVRHGGVLAGHDYGWAGSVQRGVHDAIGYQDWSDPWNTGCWIAAVSRPVEKAVPTNFK
mgnify:CR=1 FL=1